MKNISIDTNANYQQNYNFQCQFNSCGCKKIASSKEELKQHYKEYTQKHLFLFQEKILQIEAINYEIRKDYHKILKIISNIQQFKKFPELFPKFSKEKDKEDSEISKNISKKREKDIKKVMNNLINRNIQNLNRVRKQQTKDNLIGNKRKRSDKNVKNGIKEKKEEIVLSSFEDGDHENNFFINNNEKHNIYINKSIDGENKIGNLIKNKQKN